MFVGGTASIRIRESGITASSTGVTSRASGTVAVEASTVQASGPAGSNTIGLATSLGGSIAADGSTISAGSAALNNNGGTSSTIRVGGSKLSGPVATPGFGTVTCVFTYSGAYAPLSSACT